MLPGRDGEVDGGVEKGSEASLLRGHVLDCSRLHSLTGRLAHVLDQHILTQTCCKNINNNNQGCKNRSF